MSMLASFCPRPRGALTVLLAALLVVAAAPGAAAQQPVPPQEAVPLQQGIPVQDIVIRGNQRIAAPVVRVTTGLRPGTTVSVQDVQTAIQRLIATGDFEDVQVFAEGDPATGVNLIFQVEERPLISRIEFEGLERIRAGTVRDTLGLQANQPLDPNLVVRTERTIRDLLANAGVQVIAVDTTLTPVGDEPGVYRLTFRVQEGNRLAIADIEFEGNEAFDDGRLREVIKTGEEGFLWFRSGRLHRETLLEDLRQRLPEFYGRHGYVDYRTVGDTLVVDPETGKARLVIEVAEGPQYRLGEFAIQGASRFPEEQLRQMFTAQRRSVLGVPFGAAGEREAGEVFDRAALDAATQRVSQLYRNEGYLYAQVEPIVERVPTEGDQPPVVDVTWVVREGQPFYINQVAIRGNTHTYESVIRDRLMVFPGDIYNEERLIRSYEAISGLGFFETPMPLPDIRPNPDAGTVDIVFTVEEKQTGNIGLGTAIGGGGYGRSGGVSGFLSYTEPNLFGQAKQADVRLEYGYGRSSFMASYTDPYLFGTRNSGSVSLFHTDDRYRNFSFTDGRYIRTGGSLRYGFPVPGLRWTRAFLGYSLARYNYEAVDTESCEDNIFCQPDATASNLSLSVARDTKNHPLFPSAGTRQSIAAEQYGGPLGGDGNFQKVVGQAEWWTPVGQVGGGAPGSRPIVFAVGMQANLGMVFGDAGRFPLQRFYLGGTNFGQTLRGYEEATLTPAGFIPRNAQGVFSGNRFGDAYLTFTTELAARLNSNLSLSVFGDAGNIWSEPADINPTQMFRSLGVGATIVTPFGPLGLDYAYGFDRDEPGWKFHFKINQGL